MAQTKIREVIFYKSYFRDFYKELKEDVKKKIVWTIRLIETIQRVPKDYLAHMTGTEGLYEIRVKVGSDIFRIFCFFDKGNLVVLANGFQKKTQKTPKNEIEKALKIKIEYEKERKY